MKTIYKFLMVIIISIISSVSFAQDVYTTIKTNTYLNLREGPGTNYSSKGKLYNGTSVKIIHINDYENGWVCVKDNLGRVGYVSANHLVGGYIEQFNTNNNSQEKYDNEELFTNAANSFVNGCFKVFKGIINLGWWSWVIVIFALALAGGLIFWIRNIDPYFDTPWIHYLLYFIAVLPTWGMYSISSIYEDDLTFAGKCLLLLMVMVPAIITIHGGWGIRQCGMEYGKYHKNFNRHVGQFLLFPVCIIITFTFWNTILSPLIDWSDDFTYQGGGFWRFLLGLIIGAIIITGVLWIWLLIIVRYFLKTIGNNSIYIMTIVLWWGLVWIGFNWIYANFNSIGFIITVFIGALICITILATFISILNESRCPMCHNCDADQTNLTDEGVSYSTHTSWESMSDSNIRTRHSGASVSDARRLVRTTIGTHNWTTEHTCPNCGCKWNIGHSEEVSRNSRELERRWTEHY